MPAETYTAAEQAMDRDPRQAPWGLLTGGSFVLDSSRVFMWFESLADLAEHLVNHLPDGYDFEEADLEAYRSRVAPLAQRINQEGLTPGLLADLNAAIKSDMVIDWWGAFDELVAGETEFSQRLVGGFLDEGEPVRALRADELDEFVEHLKTCYC